MRKLNDKFQLMFPYVFTLLFIAAAACLYFSHRGIIFKSFLGAMLVVVCYKMYLDLLDPSTSQMKRLIRLLVYAVIIFILVMMMLT